MANSKQVNTNSAEYLRTIDSDNFEVDGLTAHQLFGSGDGLTYKYVCLLTSCLNSESSTNMLPFPNHLVIFLFCRVTSTLQLTM